MNQRIVVHLTHPDGSPKLANGLPVVLEIDVPTDGNTMDRDDLARRIAAAMKSLPLED